MNKENTLNVLMCRAGKCAEMVEIEDSLEAMQKTVGGLIEEYMPFEDDVAIVCNDEGKMLGLPLNRGIKDDEGKLVDFIAGDFFICYAPIESEKFLSLPPDLEKKYKDKFYWPEQLFLKDGKIYTTVPFNPEQRKAEVDAIHKRIEASNKRNRR